MTREEYLKYAKVRNTTYRRRLADSVAEVSKKYTGREYRANWSAEYALYRGDEFLEIGTLDELREQFGISKNTIRCWFSPRTWAMRELARPHKQRTVFVKLDEEDEDNEG